MATTQTAFLFPGQGSQHVGMAEGFMTAPETRYLFQEADDILGFSLSTLMREGDADTLQQTENAQPALLLAGFSAFTYLQKQENAPAPAVMAGHSLGEYTALTAAGVLTFADALKLVRLRGESMANAMPKGEGGMAAVLGMPPEDVAEFLEGRENVFMANDNAPGQSVISGQKQAVETAVKALKDEKGKKSVILEVSGAFHTPYMTNASHKVHTYSLSVPFIPSQSPIIMNVTGRPETQAENIKKNMINQMVSPVKWRQTLAYMAENNIKELLELGAGSILKNLAKRNDKTFVAHALTSPEAINTYLETKKKAA